VKPDDFGATRIGHCGVSGRSKIARYILSFRGSTLSPHRRGNERLPPAQARFARHFEFREWTPDNHRRHSRFLALREDKKQRRFGADAATVELDALPASEFRKRVESAVAGLIDYDLWNRQLTVQQLELNCIAEFAERMKSLPQ
jgi:hypothetical protein